MSSDEISAPMQLDEQRVAGLQMVAGTLERTFPVPWDFTTESPDIIWIHTSDEKRNTALTKAIPLLKSQLRNPKMRRAALLIASGGTPSIYPELLPEIDLLLRLDRDPRIHIFQRKQDAALLSATSIQTYTSTLYEDPAVQSLWYKSYDVELQRDMREGRCLGNLHILSSEDRLRACQEHLQRFLKNKKPIVPLFLDLIEFDALQTLGKILAQAQVEIAYLDMTNVAEIIEESHREEEFFSFSLGLTCLPVRDDVVVTSSNRIGSYDFMTTARVDQGINAYFAAPFINPQSPQNLR